MAPTTRPRPQTHSPTDSPVSDQIAAAALAWARSQHRLVMLAAELADSAEWVVAGSPTPAHHLACVADIEPCTAREWLRVATRVRELPVVAAGFADGSLSYSKVRALVTIATPDNEAELVPIALGTPAGELRIALAHWLNATSDPADLDAHQHDRRSVTWRTEPDGMVAFSIRLPPALAAVLISLLGTLVMRSRRRSDEAAKWPTVAQQHADAFETLLTTGTGKVETEVVLHVRGDGCTTDDGTPITDTAIAAIAPKSFVRALIHDADGRPINASAKRRHPSTRQRRVVKERDRACVDCRRHDLLEFDHDPPWEHTGHTLVDELYLRCAPCHHRRHAA